MESRSDANISLLTKIQGTLAPDGPRTDTGDWMTRTPRRTLPMSNVE